MAFAPLPKPKSLLGFHRNLSPSAAVKVSPLCIGGMSFGTAWEKFMGSVDKKQTYELLDYFYDQGGNFIDTANNYMFDFVEQPRPIKNGLHKDDLTSKE